MQTNEVTLGALERRIDMSVALSDIESDVGQRLKKLSRRRCASAVDAQSEQRLIESIEAFLNPAVERPILCATDREAAALPKSRHMRQAPCQTAQDRASAR